MSGQENPGAIPEQDLAAVPASLDTTTGETTPRPALKFNTADLIGERAGILGTLRTPSGSPTTRADDTNIVRVDGMETTVAVAVQLGYLAREGDRVVEVNRPGAASEPQAQQPPEHGESLQIGALDSGAVAAHGRLNAALPPVVAQHAMIRMMEGRAVDVGLIESLEGDRNAVLADIETVRAGFQQQADAFLHSQEVDAAEFYAWAQANRARELRQAVTMHVHSRNPSSYAALVSAYWRDLPPSAAALQAGGYSVRTDSQGRTLVKVHGMEMTREAAAKAGFI